jgi:hypothetical protein
MRNRKGAYAGHYYYSLLFLIIIIIIIIEEAYILLRVNVTEALRKDVGRAFLDEGTGELLDLLVRHIMYFDVHFHLISHVVALTRDAHC